MKTIKCVVLTIALCIAASPAAAELPDGWQAISNEELDSQRGGFVTDSGMEISLGIVKNVVIDGVVQFVTTLNIPNLATTTELPEFNTEMPLDGFVIGESSILADAGTIVLNQGLNTVIQNSMDGRVIEVNTIINAQIDNMNLFREIGLMNLINEQLMKAMR